MTSAFKREEKKETSLKSAPMPPLPFEKHLSPVKEAALSKEVERIAKKEGPLTLEEASILVRDLQEKGKIIREKLDDLFEKRGISPGALHRYLSDPDNFTPEQRKLMKEKKEEVMASLAMLPGLKKREDSSSNKRETKPSSSPVGISATVEGKSKGEKKFKGQRRGWIPMN